MTLTELVMSPAYKKFMAYVYGFGASIAIIGALFKILHLPGASVMLVAGLGVEALIFGLSSFEPPHEMPDWTLVYPELCGLEGGGHGHGGHGGGNASEDTGAKKGDTLAQLVQTGALDQKAVDQLAAGVQNLAKTTSQMSDLSEANVATKSYLNNVKAAADNLNQFSASQAGAIEAGQKFAARLNDEQSKLGDNLGKLTSSFAAQTETSSKLGANMAAVSDAYAKQLQGLNTQVQTNNQVTSGLTAIQQEIAASVEGVKAYKQQIASLSKTVGELNNIYGNMLSAIRR